MFVLRGNSGTTETPCCSVRQNIYTVFKHIKKRVLRSSVDGDLTLFLYYLDDKDEVTKLPIHLTISAGFPLKLCYVSVQGHHCQKVLTSCSSNGCCAKKKKKKPIGKKLSLFVLTSLVVQGFREFQISGAFWWHDMKYISETFIMQV